MNSTPIKSTQNLHKWPAFSPSVKERGNGQPPTTISHLDNESAFATNAVLGLPQALSHPVKQLTSSPQGAIQQEFSGDDEMLVEDSDHLTSETYTRAHKQPLEALSKAHDIVDELYTDGLDITSQSDDKPLPFPSWPTSTPIVGNYLRTANRAINRKQSVAATSSLISSPVNAKTAIENTTRNGKIPRSTLSELHTKADDFWRCPYKGPGTDELDEQVIKLGSKNLALVTNETGTARPTLWPELKNSNSLDCLSDLFTSALEKRRDLGLVTAQPTFKPPPRVTLTEGRREEWLNDLTNETKSLRKLSRTIPHGIHGLYLLVQCVAKGVPLLRVIWLARCVGANELRAFRRKGISESVTAQKEQEWVREWTRAVETCIETCLDKYSQADGPDKLRYAMHLAHRLYQEYLLEQDHFILWILHSLEARSYNQTAFWLVLVDMFWAEILSTFKNGRILAWSCLRKIKDLAARISNRDIFRPILTRIMHTVDRLLSTKKLALFMPESPHDFSVALDFLQSDDSSTDIEVLRALEKRNYLLAKSLQETDLSEDCVARHFLMALESALKIDEFVGAFRKSLSMLKKDNSLLDILLSWVSSNYHSDMCNVYLGLQLIRALIRTGVDVDELLLQNLFASRDTMELDLRSQNRLLAELVRCQSFSASLYLQRLITLGTLNGHASSELSNIRSARFLLDMPLLDVSSKLATLRKQHMLRHNVVSDELEVINHAKSKISQSLPRLFDHMAEAVAQTSILPPSLSRLTPRVSFELSKWLKHAVYEFLRNNPQKEDDQDRLDTSEFVIIRHVLEDLQDDIALAEVLHGIIANCDLEQILPIAQTIERHLQHFTILGKLDRLIQMVFGRYQILRITRSPVRDIVFALSDLIERFPVTEPFKQYLSRELTACNESNAMVVCTPASESLLEINSPDDQNEELERILASGPVLDRISLSLMFKSITQRIVMSEQPLLTANEMSSYLRRLRSLGEKTFDELMLSWIKGCTFSEKGLCLKDLIVPLIGSRCIRLDSLFQLAQDHHLDLERNSKIGVILLSRQILKLCMTQSMPNFSLANIDYSCQTIVQHFCASDPHSVMHIACRAIIDASTCTFDGSHEALRNILGDKSIVSLCKQAIIIDYKKSSDLLLACLQHSNKSARHDLIYFLDRVTKFMKESDQNHMSSTQLVNTMFETVDALSAPYYAVRLSMMRHLSVRNEAEHKDLYSTILSALTKSIQRGNLYWDYLIKASPRDPALLQAVRHLAETELFALCPKEEQVLKGNSYRERLAQCISVANCTSSAMAHHDLPPVAHMIISHLKNIRDMIQEQNNNITTGKLPQMQQDWTKALFNLALIQHSSISSPIHSESLFIKIISLCCQILAQGSLLLSGSLLNYIFDVIACLLLKLDSQPGACPSIISHLDPTTLHNPRVRYLLGIRDSHSSNFQLVRPGQKGTPYPLRHWELLQDATPNMGVNDTPLDLRLFGARRVD